MIPATIILRGIWPTLSYRYDNPQILRAELAGHYVEWSDVDSPFYYNGEFDDPIWDLNLRRMLGRFGNASPELFFTIHNLFSSSQYLDELQENPGRWVEAGIKVSF